MSSARKNFRADQFANRVIERNGKMGRDACAMLASAINAVDPYECVKNQIQINASFLRVGTEEINLNTIDRIILLGFGKASVPMAKAVVDLLEDKLIFAEVITKDPQYQHDDGYKDLLHVHLGGHPVPTQASIIKTREMIKRLPELTPRDHVLVLVSGGGSALFTNPLNGIHLDDLQQMTQVLLNCGANIQEINTLRKHLDQVKGGGLARIMQPAKVHSLIMSDVIGDHLDMIASGPTIPDQSTFADALSIVAKYDLENKIPSSIHKVLKMGNNGEIPETLKAKEIPTRRLFHTLVATNFDAARAANQKAKTLGYDSQIASYQLTGLTDDVAHLLEGVIQTERQQKKSVDHPLCLIFGGEPTVRVKGAGLGGRNQDLVLRMVERIAGIPDLLLISLATDGEDGPTDAAGAAADGNVLLEGVETYGMKIDEFIQKNDAYHYFENIGGLIKIGATGTNVNDLILILMDKRFYM